MQEWEMKEFLKTELETSLAFSDFVRADTYLFETPSGFNLLRRKNHHAVRIEVLEMKIKNGVILARVSYSWLEGNVIKRYNRLIDDNFHDADEIIATAASEFREALVA